MTRAPSRISIALVAVGMLLGASCDTPPSYDRAAILRDLADHVIVPGYAELATCADAMQASATTLCASPSAASLMDARTTWSDAFAQFEHASAYGVGPARDMNLSSEMGFWPISPDAIERNVAATDPIDAHYVDALGAASKGMLAIGYLLYGGTADPAWTPPTDDAVIATMTGRRCTYLVALTDHAARTSHALADAWSPTGGNFAETLASAGAAGNARYADVTGALIEVLTQMLDTLKTVKNTKLGIPIGHRTMMPSPRAVQSPYADVNVLSMRAATEGAREVWTAGGDGTLHSFDRLVASANPDLAEMVEGEYDGSVAGLVALAQVLTTNGQTFEAYAAGTDHSVGETAYSRVDAAETTIATEVAATLGLQLGFSDMDGD